jgi:hypothetical protein
MEFLTISLTEEEKVFVFKIVTILDLLLCPERNFKFQAL